MLQDKPFRVRHKPRFDAEFDAAVYYIANELCNPAAADRLIDAVERAVHKRAQYPRISEKVYLRKGGLPNYRIYVGNYVVYYVVIGRIMEARRKSMKSNGLFTGDGICALKTEERENKG